MLQTPPPRPDCETTPVASPAPVSLQAYRDHLLTLQANHDARLAELNDALRELAITESINGGLSYRQQMQRQSLQEDLSDLAPTREHATASLKMLDDYLGTDRTLSRESS